MANIIQPIGPLFEVSTVGDYTDLESCELVNLCAARACNLLLAQTRNQQIQLIRESDERRKREDETLQKKYAAFNNRNDPTYEHRIDVARGISELKVRRLQVEAYNTAMFAREWKAEQLDRIKKFEVCADKTKDNTEVNVPKTQLLFEEFKAASLRAVKERPTPAEMHRKNAEIAAANRVEKEKKVRQAAKELQEERAALLEEDREVERLEDERLVDRYLDDEYQKLQEIEDKDKERFARRRQKLDDNEDALEQRRGQETEQSAEVKKETQRLKEHRRRLKKDEKTSEDFLERERRKLDEKAKLAAITKKGQDTAKKLEQATHRKGDSKKREPVADLSRTSHIGMQLVEKDQPRVKELLRKFDEAKANKVAKEKKTREAAKELQEGRYAPHNDAVKEVIQEAAHPNSADAKGSREQPAANMTEGGNRAALQNVSDDKVEKAARRGGFASYNARTERLCTEQPEEEPNKEVEEAARQKAAREIEAEKQSLNVPAKELGMTRNAATVPEASEYDTEDTIVVDSSSLLLPRPTHKDVQARAGRQRQQQHELGAEKDQAGRPEQSQQKATENSVEDTDPATQKAARKPSDAQTVKDSSHRKVPQEHTKRQDEPAGKMQLEDVHRTEPAKRVKRRPKLAQATMEEGRYDLATTTMRGSSDATYGVFERQEAFGHQVEDTKKTQAIAEAASRGKTFGDMINDIIAQRVKAEALGVPPPPKTQLAINFNNQIEAVIARIKEKEDRQKGPRQQSLRKRQAEPLKQNEPHQASEQIQRKQVHNTGDDEQLFSKIHNKPDAASAGASHIKLTTDSLITASDPALNKEIQLNKGRRLRETLQPEIPAIQSAIVAAAERTAIPNPLKNPLDDTNELTVGGPDAPKTMKLKRTLSAGAVASPIETKKVRVSEAADPGPSSLPTKAPLLKAMNQFLVVNPAAPLRNPHIFIGLMKASTEEDLKRTWDYILQEAPEQCAFVTFIKSDNTGQFIGFQDSGDGALAARDCYILACEMLRNKFARGNISLKLALYEDESRRVAKDYTFNLVD